MEIKKSLHVRRSTIFPLKIGEEQKKKYLRAARSLSSSGVEEFFMIFKISLFATHLYKFLKDHYIGMLLINLDLFLQIHHSLETSI